MILKTMQKRHKKGVSPVVATVLLIVIALVLALIIFFWIKSLIGESVVKFDGQNTETLCSQVEFDATYSPGSKEVSLFNSGEIPIYDFEVFIKRTGGHKTVNLKESSNPDWPAVGLRSGETFFGVVDASSDLANANEIILIPVLRGKGLNSGQMKTIACKQNVGISVFKK